MNQETEPDPVFRVGDILYDTGPLSSENSKFLFDEGTSRLQKRKAEKQAKKWRWRVRGATVGRMPPGYRPIVAVRRHPEGRDMVETNMVTGSEYPDPNLSDRYIVVLLGKRESALSKAITGIMERIQSSLQGLGKDR